MPGEGDDHHKRSARHRRCRDAQASSTFALANSFIAATDLVLVRHISATNGGAWSIDAIPAAGSCSIVVRNISTASITEATPLQFFVLKGATS